MRPLSLFIFIFIFSLWFSITAQAEYRVFMLLLENKKTGAARQIQSTLDPEQYVSLYPLARDEVMTYVQTWRCPGRTDFFKPTCPNPKLDSKPNNGASPVSN